MGPVRWRVADDLMSKTKRPWTAGLQQPNPMLSSASGAVVWLLPLEDKASGIAVQGGTLAITFGASAVALSLEQKKRPLAAAFSNTAKAVLQMFFISTLRSLSNSSSISALVMISGGESAMMSPVVRIRRPSL